MSKILGISRIRTGTDGRGITTLVGFSGCPLKCKYCINDNCHESDKYLTYYSPEELLDALMVDDIYFRMTGGGVTFGGGEPLLNWQFIQKFAMIAPPAWKIRVETSLNVSIQNVRPLIGCIDQWIIDIKDMNPKIYKEYTGINGMKAYRNLEYLYSHGEREKLHIRVPRISGYNTPDDVKNSIQKLQKYNCHIEEFTYTSELTSP